MAQLTELAAPARLDTSALGRRGARRALAFVGGGLIALLAVGAIAFEVSAGGSTTPGGLDYVPPIIVACLAFGLPGAALMARGDAPKVAGLTMLTGLSLGLAGFATGWAIRAVSADPGSLPAGEAAIWLSSWCWVPGFCAIAIVLLFLPDDRLPSSRWRSVLLAAWAGVVLLALGTAISPYALDDLPSAYGERTNPLEADGLGQVLTSVAAIVLIACALLAVASLAVRFRSASGRERDQLKWVALGGAFTVVLLLGATLVAGDVGDWVAAAGMVPLPAGIAIAVARHQLWDVDLVINRTLVYGALSVIVVIAYVALVSLIGTLVDDTVAGIAAVAVVAVALQPVHERVQRAVNQLVYGDRDDPAAALRRLGDRLVAAGEPDEVLPAVAETVARALRLPWVSVHVEGGAIAAHGSPPGRAEPATIELLYRGELVGELLAAPRDPGRGFSPADLRALEAIGRQVAVAAHAVRLTDDLRRSRERLVLAREEERRRLRHDLHDELGPTLAALALELESARDLARERPDQVNDTLDRAAARARDSVADVRRLVYELRPPSLDDLGLAAALAQRAEQLCAGSMTVTLDVDEELGVLPAAVESAAYRIGSEALSNVARHAGAGAVTITLGVRDARLALQVSDDGSGFGAGVSHGVGLRSMRERAEELGGAFDVGPGPAGGVVVSATLPLEAGR